MINVSQATTPEELAAVIDAMRKPAVDALAAVTADTTADGLLTAYNTAKTAMNADPVAKGIYEAYVAAMAGNDQNAKTAARTAAQGNALVKAFLDAETAAKANPLVKAYFDAQAAQN